MSLHRLCLSAVIAGAMSTSLINLGEADERPGSSPARRPLSMIDALQQRGDEEVGGGLPQASARSSVAPRVAGRMRPMPPRGDVVHGSTTRPQVIPHHSLSGPSVTTPKPPHSVAPTTSAPQAIPASTPIATTDLEVVEARVRKTLDTYFDRKLNTREHNCWEMMHALIAYGVETEIVRVGTRNESVNAAAWLCANGVCNNYQLMYNDRGRVKAKWGVGLQGHYGQFLAILAQSHVALDYTIKVDGKDFTVNDLLESEKLGCRSGIELTFKLLSIAHYSDDLDKTWKNELGQEWSVAKLINEEIAAPILRGAACGGTHRLTGLAHAVHKRERLGQPMDGQFKRAKKYLDDYHKYTLALQNADGSFSTEWFRGTENRSDIDRKLQTTGHILEWLVYSLPKEELTQPKVVKAVNYLAGIMLAEPNRTWEIGPTGHALHALAIYDSRVFVPLEKEAAAPVAKIDPTTIEHVAEKPTRETDPKPASEPALKPASEPAQEPESSDLSVEGPKLED